VALAGPLFARALRGNWDRRRAAFDKLRLRTSLSAATGLPHPEHVEGRTVLDAID
jgi:hypothetical protein